MGTAPLHPVKCLGRLQQTRHSLRVIVCVFSPLAIQHRKRAHTTCKIPLKSDAFCMTVLDSWKMTTLEPTAWIENDRYYQNQHGRFALNFINFQRPSAWAQFFWHNVCKARTLMLALPTLVHAERKLVAAAGETGMIPKTICRISDRKAWCFNVFPPLFGMCGLMTDSMIVKFAATKVLLLYDVLWT